MLDEKAELSSLEFSLMANAPNSSISCQILKGGEFAPVTNAPIVASTDVIHVLAEGWMPEQQKVMVTHGGDLLANTYYWVTLTSKNTPGKDGLWVVGGTLGWSTTTSATHGGWQVIDQECAAPGLILRGLIQ